METFEVLCINSKKMDLGRVQAIVPKGVKEGEIYIVESESFIEDDKGKKYLSYKINTKLGIKNCLIQRFIKIDSVDSLIDNAIKIKEPVILEK